MALGTLDVDLVPDFDGLFREINRRTSDLTASVDVKAAVDARSVEAASARVETAVGDVSARVLAAPDVASAVTAEAVLASEVGVVNADVVATANLGSAHLAEEALEAAVGTINAEVSVSASGAGGTGALASELDRVTSSALGATSAIGGIGLAIGGSVVAAKQAGDLLIGLADSASAVGEAANVTEVTFGSAAAQINAFAEDAAAAIGQSRSAALAAAGDFGAFGKAAGLTGTELASFSTGLVTLTSDAASFVNTTPDEAVLAFGAALRGEYEPIRRYRVLLDEAAVANAAVAAGIAKPGEELTRQQKILARYQAILAQTTDLQGDFARTVGESVPNQMRVAAASFEDFQAKLGEAVLPSLMGILESVTPVIESISEPLTELVAGISAGFEAAAPGLAAAVEAISEAIGELAPIFPVLGDIAGVLAEELGAALSDLVEAGTIEDIVEGFASMMLAVRPLIPIMVKLATLFDVAVVNALSVAARAITTFAEAAVSAVADVTGGVSLMLSVVNTVADGLVPDGWISGLDRLASQAADSANRIADFRSETELTDRATNEAAEGIGGALSAIGGHTIGTATTAGLEAVSAAAEGVAADMDLAAEAAEQNHARIVAAFTSGPSIADLFGEGETVEAAVAKAGELEAELNKQAFGLAALRTAGFKSLLAEAVSIDDPAKAGEFIDGILTLPPEKQAKLEAAAAANAEAAAKAAEAVAAEQGASIGVALGEAQRLGLLSVQESMAQTGEDIGVAIGEGMGRGMLSTLSDVQRSAAVVADGLAERMRTKLEIRSPSKVFEQIGEQITAGLIEGITATSSTVAGAVDQMVPTTSTTPVVRPQLSGIGGAARPPVGGGLTVEVNAPQLDPWRSGRELARQIVTELGVDAVGPQGVSF